MHTPGWGVLAGWVCSVRERESSTQDSLDYSSETRWMAQISRVRDALYVARLWLKKVAG